MIKKRRNQLARIYKQSQALSNWLWMGVLLDDKTMVRQDLAWAKEIAQEITDGLAVFSRSETKKASKTPSRRTEARGRMAKQSHGQIGQLRAKPVIAENIETGETMEFASGKAAAAALGVYRSAISRVINGKAKSTKGYRFRFAD